MICHCSLKSFETISIAKGNNQAFWLDRAYEICVPIYDKLKKITFDCCTGVAAQGNWDGKCELLPNGDRIVRGEHKIDNGLVFRDYKDIREMVANAIMEIRKFSQLNVERTR